MVLLQSSKDCEDFEIVYTGGTTIFLVRFGRVVGMFLLFTELPLETAKQVPKSSFGRVRT